MCKTICYFLLFLAPPDQNPKSKQDRKGGPPLLLLLVLEMHQPLGVLVPPVPLQDEKDVLRCHLPALHAAACAHESLEKAGLVEEAAGLHHPGGLSRRPC